MNRVVVFGNRGIAEIAHFYLTQDSQYEVAGFSVDAQFLDGDSFAKLPLVAFEEIEKYFPPAQYKMLVAVSYTQLNKIRTEKYQAAKKLGYQFISYINSQCSLSGNTEIGENCFILENVVVQPFVRIGNNVTIWSGSHIGHHATIQDNCFVTSHVVVSGNVEVGSNSFLGVNSTIRDGVKIGDRCIVGAGALILQDTEPDSVYKASGATKSSVPSNKVKL